MFGSRNLIPRRRRPRGGGLDYLDYCLQLVASVLFNLLAAEASTHRPHGGGGDGGYIQLVTTVLFNLLVADGSTLRPPGGGGDGGLERFQ